MKQELAPRHQHETDESFIKIIENEYGVDAAPQAMGETATRQALPFGDQFMREIPPLLPNPKATNPGGRTVSNLKIDDVLEVDVL